MSKRTTRWTPSAEQQALWPAISGNTLNGVGEPDIRQPTPIYWHAPESTPHGPLQLWFYTKVTPFVQRAREERMRANAEPVDAVADSRVERTAEEWTARVKAAALAAGADAVGITAVRPEWVYEGHAVAQQWAIVLCVAHDWSALQTAPDERAAAEVILQYARGVRTAKALANVIRADGHDAVPHGGPMAYPMLLLPAAISAGLGELGKHGSLIHPTLGSNLRLAMVLTDIPLVPDTPQEFGADDFCRLCKSCADACPPEAIQHEKRMVRGVERWYVEFDKCLPFFNEHQGCAICLASCPWNRPGVAETLVRKLAVRRGRSSNGSSTASPSTA